jgi:hypothetical protein
MGRIPAFEKLTPASGSSFLRPNNNHVQPTVRNVCFIAKQGNA